MSRKWTETSKPCRCIDCSGFDRDHTCTTKNFEISHPDWWRYCSCFNQIVRNQHPRT